MASPPTVVSLSTSTAPLAVPLKNANRSQSGTRIEGGPVNHLIQKHSWHCDGTGPIWQGICRICSGDTGPSEADGDGRSKTG